MLQALHEMNLNSIDYGIIGIIGISILVGMVRGFVREAMSLITWVIALCLAVIYCETVAAWFSAISVLGIRLMLAFVLIVLATLIVGGIVSHLISQLIRSTRFSITDRIIGTVFGFARGAAIVAILIVIASSTFVVKESFWTASALVPEFTPLSSWIKEKLPTDFIAKIFAPKKTGPEMELVPVQEQPVTPIEPVM